MNMQSVTWRKPSKLFRPFEEVFRQVYEHAISNHHKKAVFWFKESASSLSMEVDIDFDTPSILDNFDINDFKIRNVNCHYLWDFELVEEFKGDSQIRRKSPKTLYSDLLWEQFLT